MVDITPEQIKIAVLDERMKGLDEKVTNVHKTVERIEDKLDNQYVKQKDYDTLKLKVGTLWDWRFKVMAWAFIGGIIGSIVLRIIPFERIFG